MVRVVGWLLITMAVMAGCVGDDGAGTATAKPAPTASATRVVTEPRPSSTAAPAPTATVAMMTVGDTRPLDVGPARARLERYEPEAYPGIEEWMWQKLYRVDADEVWTVVGNGGTPFWLWLAPDRDIGVGIATGHGEAATEDQATILVDLARGTVRQVVPFSFELRSWSGPDRVLARLSPRTVRERAGEWTPGVYELDLERSVATLISTREPFRLAEVSVPAGSALGRGVFEWRIDADAGDSALIVRDDQSGAETVVADQLANLRWSPDGGYAALVRANGSVSILDINSGREVEIDLDGRSVFDVSWSPDGRYLIAARVSPAVVFDLSRLVDDFETAAIVPIGPFEDSIFGDWGPSGSDEALLLAGYCGSREFRLERLDLADGETTAVPTAVGGFWVYDWSPRGDLIAVSSFEDPSGFDLVDPVTGAGTPRPNLEAAVTSMQDVAWSASGEWIQLSAIGGRDRCV